MEPWRWVRKRRLKPGVKLWFNRVFAPSLTQSAAVKAHIYDTHDGELIVCNGPETFVVSTKDRVIGRKLYASGGFDFEKLDLARRLYGKPTQDMVLVDVGANVGSNCIPALKRGQFARAIAIEPEPLNAKLLRANLILNEVDERAEVIIKAAGNQKGKTELHLSSINLGDHRLDFTKGAEPDRQAIEVEIDTLDAMLAPKDRPHVFLFMDTQGSEGHVLAGATETIAHAPPLIIEFSPSYMGPSQSFPALCTALQHAGYLYFYDLSEQNPERQQLTKPALEALYKTHNLEKSKANPTGISETDLFLIGGE